MPGEIELSAIVLAAITDAVFAQLADYLVHEDRLLRWLKLDPARLAFQKGLARAYTTFARQYPDLVAALFDQSFLKIEAVPEIAKLFTRDGHPNPAELARLWAASIAGSWRGRPDDSLLVRAAADFCGWLRAELRAEKVFQPLFDSQALDRLPEMEGKLDAIVQELAQLREQAIKIAASYEQTIQRVSIRGDYNIVGSNNQVIYNQYLLGDTPDDLYVRPDAVFQRVDIDHFAGREWLDARVDEFLQKNRSGVFLLVGEAGVGKTAFLAHLAQERRYLHLFAEQVPGDANVSRAIQSLGAQLVARYRIAGYEEHGVMPQVASSPDFLDRLIRIAAENLNLGEKLVIVCDALDEAGAGTNGNVFGLPKVLPDNVYLILAQRPVYVRLNFDFPPQTEHLEALSRENTGDVLTFLAASARRPVIADQLKARGYTDQDFVRLLAEKCGGVWMYLHYVIREIEAGSRHPLELEKLPAGLAGYYAGYWGDWREGQRGEGRAKWHSLYAPLLGLLAAVQEPASAAQFAAWGGLDEGEIQELLGESWRAYIAEQPGEAGERLYRIYHTSLRDFISHPIDEKSTQPGQDYLVRDLARHTQAAHKKIIAYYRSQCAGDWICLAVQDYPRRYLAYHLAGAGLNEELYALTIRNDAWAAEKFRLEGHHGGYLSDLGAVFGYLKDQPDISNLARAGLCNASIISAGANIGAELLALCVQEKVLPLETALVYAGQKPDFGKRARAYFRIWLGLPEDQKPVYERRILSAALDAAQNIYFARERATSMAELAPHLPSELKEQVMGNALGAARAINDEYSRSRVLAELAPHLPQKLLGEALGAARAIEDEDTRSRALAGLAPYLPPELKEHVVGEALGVARAIKDEFSRSRALAELEPHLPPELKEQVVGEALGVARAIKDEFSRSSALAELAWCLSPELKEQVVTEALTAAKAIEDEYDRSNALKGLAPHLTPGLRGDALKAIRTIKAKDIRSSALVTMVLHLPIELKEQVGEEALMAARAIKDENDRSRALADLMPYLPADMQKKVVDEALAAARAINDEYDRSHAFAKLMRYLPQELLREMLATVRAIEDEDARSRALMGLAPYLLHGLKEQIVGEALTVARRIKNKNSRAIVLTELLQYLSTELREQILCEALTVAREIKDEYSRTNALIGLAPYLPKKLKRQVVKEVLEVAREVKDDDIRSYVLEELVSYLLPEQMGEALAIIRAIKDEYTRSRALAGLAPHLPLELMELVMKEALEAARAIKDEYNRSMALLSTVVNLPKELKEQGVEEALATVRAIKDEGFRYKTLAKMLPCLPHELKEQVMGEVLQAQTIENIDSYSWMVNECVLQLPPKLRGQVMSKALAEARAVENQSLRFVMLTRLVPLLDEIHLADLLNLEILRFGETVGLENIVQHWSNICARNRLDEYQLLHSIIFRLSGTSRSRLLGAIQDLIPVFQRVGGQEALAEITGAILDTARWWP